MRKSWMMAARIAVLALGVAGISGCPMTAVDDIDTPAPRPYLGRLAQTLLRGQSDNAETVRAIPGKDLAILGSSKARKMTLLKVTGDRLEAVREKALFPNDPSESELTNLAVSPDGAWAVATRTFIVSDQAGKQTACGGELVFFDATDSEAFGTVLKQVAVGPMPDAVAVSPDGKRVVSADERDGPDAWGKCEVADAKASISVLDLSQGPAAARLLHQITMVDGATGPREPESVAISKDGDLVAVTLQDSHELALFRLSQLAGKEKATSADIQIVALPPNALGAKPWPDGVLRFEDGAGKEHFAVAGEWNDALLVVDADGKVVANVEISPRDVPESFPRVIKEDYPLFEPDSLAAFVFGERQYLAVTLRQAGAVAVYDVSDAAAPAYRTAIQVGHEEKGRSDEDGSTIRPEGVCASPDGRFLLTANEAESSVSLVVPAE